MNIFLLGIGGHHRKGQGGQKAGIVTGGFPDRTTKVGYLLGRMKQFLDKIKLILHIISHARSKSRKLAYLAQAAKNAKKRNKNNF